MQKLKKNTLSSKQKKPPGDGKRSARKSVVGPESPSRRSSARKSVHAPDLMSLARLSDMRTANPTDDADTLDSGSASSLKSGDVSQ